MRSNIEGNRSADFLIERGLRLASQEWVPASGDAINANMPPMLIVNPAGAINLKMPTSSPAIKGLTFLIVNPSANAVTLQTDGGAGFTTAIVLAAGESTIVFCTGSATQALGWRAIATAPST